jgi:TetR/AcrR family tetracycline transcriptional repressor
VTVARLDLEKRTRRPRGSLSREEILDATRQLVEERGLPKLSMQGLADQLHAGVNSVYTYFPSKAALLDALAGSVVHDLRTKLPPIGTGPWDEELVEYFVEFRNLLLEETAYLELIAYGPAALVHRALSAASQRRFEEGLDLLGAAGLDRPAALRGFAACLNYTRGFVVLERGGQHEYGEISSAAREHAEVAQFDALDDEQFIDGLRLLVRGIRADT